MSKTSPLSKTPLNKTHWIADADIEWEILDEYCKRKIMAYNDGLMIVKVHFKKGGIGAIHQHIHTQGSYVESGVFEVIIGDEKKILKQGDVFFIPPSIDHGVVALEEGVLVDSFNPMRADFIQ
jgi:quercetin dioxygenase-like cupin family protein